MFSNVMNLTALQHISKSNSSNNAGNEILVKPNAMVVQASPVVSLDSLHCVALFFALQFVAFGWLAMKYW